MNEQFVVASASGNDSDELVANLFAKTKQAAYSANFGFLYVTETLATNLDEILQKIRQQFDVQDWIGTVGVGVCCTGREIYDQPAAVIMLANLQNYQLFETSSSGSNISDDLVELKSKIENPSLAVIHGNPMQAKFPQVFQDLCTYMSDTFFVGGLSSSNNIAPQVLNQVTESTISGVVFQDSSHMVVAHTQGCTPLEGKHVITKCNKNLIMELDHRPALEVFKQDVGEVLAKDLEKIAGYIFAGLPVPHSDTNDYLVRNIVGFDLNNSIIAIGDYVEQDDPIVFCRRDGNSATEDLIRMLRDIKTRMSTQPKGALYFSCLARGRNQFGEDSVELKTIQQHLGDVPLVGFFANGEILHNRLYGYTGVLTIFL